MKRNISLVLVLFFSCTLLFAEEFQLRAKLDSVPARGFYKILLNPDIISLSMRDYSDIRLLNAQGIEVPYIFREESPATATTGFKEYTILENRYIPGKKITRVEIHNSGKLVMSNLILVVRNSEIQKEISLKGSDDRKNWYIIQRGRPSKSGKFSVTSGMLTMSFPEIDYEYLEITIDDKKKDPLQVLKTGYFDSQVMKGMYSEIPVKEILRKDSSDKKSYITILFNRDYELSKLLLHISAPELYRRDCYIATFRMDKQKRSFEILDHFEVSSGKPTSFETGKIKTRELVLVIENADNIPLQISGIQAFQLNKYLIAKLSAGESYEVCTGNARLLSPDYDLKFFTDSISEALTVLTTGKPSISEPAKSSGTQVLFTKTILWVVIILVIGLLGFLSVRMMSEMRKEK